MTSTSDQQLALQAQQPTAPVAPGLSVPSYTSRSSAPNIAPPAPAANVGYDHNSDGNPDLIWRNYATGKTAVWNGTLEDGAFFVFTINDPNWKLVGNGDFTGAGKNDDLLWRNYATGENVVWKMEGTDYTGTLSIAPVADPTWKIEGTGDFTGDGKTDILWRNYVTGDNVVWKMNGTTFDGSTYLQPEFDPNWKIATTGDFNADGKVDIVWRNYVTGQNVMWFMNGTTPSGITLMAPTEGPVDPNWKITGSGDFGGPGGPRIADGKADIVWRNQATGNDVVWFMDGNNYIGGEFLRVQDDLNWHIALNDAVLDNAPNTPAYARNITVNANTNTYSDWIGTADTLEYYKFTLGSSSEFNAALTGLGANADLQLLDSNGTAIAGSGNTGTTSETITKALNPGTYYLKVMQGSTTENTHYNLSVSTSGLLVLNKNNALTLSEEGIGAISQNQLEVTEKGKTATQLTYKLSSYVNNGILLKNGNGIVTGGTFTQDDINKGLISYKHNGSETTSDAFIFTVSDGAGGTLGNTTFFFNITPVNDPAVLNANPGMSLNEGATATINPINLKATDPDNPPAQLIYTIGAGGLANGTLLNNGKALAVGGTFTQADIDNKLIAYQHNGSETTSDSFNFTLSEGGAGGTVGNFKFNVVPVNDIPVMNANPGMSLKEGETGIINTINLKATDPDSTAAKLIYTLGTGGLANGTLLNNGKAVVAGGTFTQADIDNKLLSYQHNGSETTSDSFNFTVSDGVGGTVGNTNFKFNVIPVNDAPVLDNIGSPILTAIRQNQPLNTNIGTLVSEIIGDSISDVDITPPPVEGIALTTVDNTNGSWEFSIDNGASWTAVGNVSVSSSRLVAATNTKLRFVPKADFFGTATINFRAWDQTSGINGGTADTSVNGGITAFSTAVETATITVRKELALTKVINPGSSPSNPQQFTVAGKYMYFVADGTLITKDSNKKVGRELWRTDGSIAGTTLVKDIFAGSIDGEFNSSSPDNLTNVGGVLYFTADDGVNGREVWRTDGTEAGTTLVKDINTGIAGSTPDNLTAVGNKLFFTANNTTKGLELWSTDGTTAGTQIVKDITSGTNSSNLNNLAAFNGKLYFSANTADNGTELWTSDGTEAGTILFKDIRPGIVSSNLDNLTVVGNRLFFTADNGSNGAELWATDGTAGGTTMVKDIYAGLQSSLPANLTSHNGKLYFTADDGSKGAELWTSDGTDGGTKMVADINNVKVGDTVRTFGSAPSDLTSVGNKLYFAASGTTTPATGNELWVLDGMAAPALVKDINPGANGSFADNLTNVNGKLYFTAANVLNGEELWTSDGTTAGTVLVKDILTGADGASPANLTSFNNTLYFAVDNAINGNELWTSSGTAAGTVLFKDINQGSEGGYIENLAAGNNRVYFTAQTPTEGTELWTSDGTDAGTFMVKDINPGLNSSSPTELINVNGIMYFSADDGTNGSELWKSDGTPAGTVMVKNINTGVNNSSPTNITNLNGTVYFTADNGTNGFELWRSNGTDAGTTLVKDIFTGSGSSSPSNLTVVGNALYFTAYDSTNGMALWKIENTQSAPTLVKTINLGSGGVRPPSPDNFTVVGNTLYFTANDGASGVELWTSTGTAAGTARVKDIRAGSGGSSPTNLTNVGGTLYFTANDGTGNKLWKTVGGTDAGTTTVTIQDSSTPQQIIGSAPDSLAAVGNILYFAAADATFGRELWQLDTTTGVTKRVMDINAGIASSNPDKLINVKGTLYFTAESTVIDPITNQPAEVGTELWRIDTIKGPILVKDLNLGTSGSDPDMLTNVDGTLYFVANDGFYGDQVYSI